MRKKLISILAAALLLGGAIGAAAAPVSAGILATEVCVTIYEDTNTSNDHWTYCALPSSAKQASLVGDTVGLHNGCNGATTRPDWNDCVSAVYYGGLPANYRLRIYSEINYGYSIPHLPMCWDANGSGGGYVGFYMNDLTSSWRVESGNC